ncbi:hypothetical protein KBJ98_08455 [Flavobacterium sp. F-328]|uniref:VWA domain-containing protein n=1 Tax=Flavobacterium erciyesense TaxID=2825842 RepID=A0ABS5D3Y7_9FLAO|nr:hypothetical protein [Flavobacterium erciyesense]MBQ0908729.1 hypothetical protein [Flavobacterium erciyesense]
MTTNTILLILLSLILAGVLSYLQYIFKAKNQTKTVWFLAFLRFLSLFGILLLLINPIVIRKTLELFKTPLAIVVDNSSSISFLEATKQAKETMQALQQNAVLQEKFEIQSFQFSNTMEPFSQLDFKGNQSNIDVVAKNLKSNFKNKTFATVLISDGNQTSGSDYVFQFDPENKVYLVAVGDTTTYLDLKISQLNANKYAFYKNKFPVEVFLQYAGKQNVTASFSISQGNNVVVKQSVSFSASKNTATLNLLLPADKVGLQMYQAKISSNLTEKNRYNNVKNFAVEVQDQKTAIAIVSAIDHPDIGAFKRAIETNAQRKVTVVKPNQINNLRDFNILIFYQPTAAFKSVFEGAKNAKISSFVVTGMSTDFNFLNQQQNDLNFKMSGQSEDYLSVLNTDFNLFATDDIGFDAFPPLQNAFGTIAPKAGLEILLSSKIRVMNTNAPLLAFAENENQRTAYLLGENSWKWRLQSHIKEKSFEKYDRFIDKIIQYLGSKAAKKPLVVDHERFYNAGESIVISAQYFNKNYEADDKARLTISLLNKKTKQQTNYDLLKAANGYKVNLDGLKAGTYQFTVKELNSNTTYSSSLEIIDFDIEKQFVNSDIERLSQLASQTSGQLFYPSQVDKLIQTLLENKDYQTTQKEIVVKTPLLDWVWLLVIIALLLATEWLVRKYNGML